MKTRILNALAVITSLFGYLEWGNNNASFLFEVEYELIAKLFTEPLSVIHPFTLIPLLGQVLLLITLFQQNPGKILTYVGIICVGLLLGLIFLIGLIEFDLKTLVSAFPFIIVGIASIRNISKKTDKFSS